MITKPKSNVHYGAGVFVYGANSSFEMQGGAIQENQGMVGVGVYVRGSVDGNASFKMTGGKIDNNDMSNVGKSSCDGGGIYAEKSAVNLNYVIIDHNTACGNNTQGGSRNLDKR